MTVQQGLTVLGLGSVGAATAGRLQNMLPEGLPVRVLAIDTDKNKLENSGVAPENRLLAAQDWRNGRGCGGEVLDGQRALSHERSSIEKLIGTPEFLLVTAAFGGGTATGGAGIIQSICRKNDIPVIFLVTLPFSQEGHSRRQAAEDAIRQDLLTGAEAVLALPNDLLYSVLPPATPVLQAYDMANRELAETALAITLLLTQNNILAPETEDLAAILHRKKGFCSIGVGHAVRADGADCCLKALEKMLQAPLLGGADKIWNADAVIMSLIGGSDLSIGEVRQTLDAAMEFIGPSAKILSGASVEPTFGDRVMVCCVTVKFDDSADEQVLRTERPAAAGAAARKPRQAKQKTVKPPANNAQQEFAFENQSKGMMEKTQPVIWNGEDLDDPTWRRRSTPIDKGTVIAAE
ncbi:MAG: hypothetical protein IKD46_03880 [Lentisphaeria bacterium]|nr:hypothetical protein [Lentisphaeria bacterium]